MRRLSELLPLVVLVILLLSCAPAEEEQLTPTPAPTPTLQRAIVTEDRPAYYGSLPFGPTNCSGWMVITPPPKKGDEVYIARGSETFAECKGQEIQQGFIVEADRVISVYLVSEYEEEKERKGRYFISSRPYWIDESIIEMIETSNDE